MRRRAAYPVLENMRWYAALKKWRFGHKIRHGKEFVLEGDHLLARAICHECDHLDGRLFKDIAIRMLHQDEDGNWK